MCGISGFVRLSGDMGAEELLTLGKRMSGALRHRGPDDEGHWVEAENGVVFGQRRLSIIDLSPEGHQPMVSADGRYVITFNGEIYNFQDLRQELERAGHIFRGHSDTEVLLASIQYRGLDETLSGIYGMFAFALWDRHTKTLSLARDHIGKKPLYFGYSGRNFVFASELKAVTALPDFEKVLNRGAMSLFVRHNYIPAPWSVFQNIYKLVPGGVLRLDFSQALPSGADLPDHVRRYWSVYAAAHEGQRNLFSGSFDEAVGVLEEKLRRAVSLRMVSDVPLGAFLSGGVDSSLVVALMQAQSSQKIKTYSIGFEESGFDESVHAEAVAAHLGTEHETFFVTADETRDVIPHLADIYDEPFADMSQIPTWHVCRLARQNVTVALSGDGGDESFAGYERYGWAQSLSSRILCYPEFVRRPLGAAVRAVPPAVWDALLSPVQGVLEKKLGRALTGHRLHTASLFFSAQHFDALYLSLMSHWKDPAVLVKDGVEPVSPMTDPGLVSSLDSVVHRAMLCDMQAYLPDDILVKVDRASMAHSLEVRAPLLDKNVVEWAWTLPLSYVYEGGQGKRILKSLLSRYLPPSFTDRPKQGFGVPMGPWLRGPLREWAENFLKEDVLERHGLFCAEPVRRAWDEHVSGTRDRSYYLWDILMAQAWAERWL